MFSGLPGFGLLICLVVVGLFCVCCLLAVLFNSVVLVVSLSLGGLLFCVYLVVVVWCLSLGLYMVAVVFLGL